MDGARSHGEWDFFAVLVILAAVGIMALVFVGLVGHQIDAQASNDGGTGDEVLLALDTCQARGALPDPQCTSGAVDPRVTQNNIQQTICVPGYTAKVRPPTSYTDPLKGDMMARYGVATKNELDHLIPLALGGAPRNVMNLWPQAEEPRPGYHEKDRVERLLQLRVCSGEMMLDDARAGVAANWLQYLSEARATAMAEDFDDAGEP